MPRRRRRSAILALLAAAALAMPAAQAAVRVVIIEGLAGEPLYARQFDEQVRALAGAARAIDGAGAVWILAGPAATRTHILAQFQRLASQMQPSDRLILYLIGHGSFDGRQYKFNISGPDLSDADLKGVLQGLPAERQLVIATGSASGALLPVLSAPHRVLLTATRNGDEKNATRFGAALVAALHSPEADTDKDGRISAQEAYAFASRAVQEAYRQATLLASEHAVLQGQEARDFVLASLSGPVPDDGAGGGPRAAAGGAAGAAAGGAAGRPGGTAPASPNVPSGWIRRRAALNASIAALEERKGALPSDQYEARLQRLLLQLAILQQQIDRAAAAAQTGRGGAHAPP